MAVEFSVRDAVTKRYSVRTYDKRPVEKEIRGVWWFPIMRFTFLRNIPLAARPAALTCRGLMWALAFVISIWQCWKIICRGILSEKLRMLRFRPA